MSISTTYKQSMVMFDSARNACSYLKEASEILTGDSRSSAYLAGSECITMPLKGVLA